MVIKWPFKSCIFPNTFLTKLKIKGKETNYVFCIAFDPIKIVTCLALENDFQNLSFVKANVVGKKMTGNTCKMAISCLCHFRFETEFISIERLFSDFLLVGT